MKRKVAQKMKVRVIFSAHFIKRDRFDPTPSNNFVRRGLKPSKHSPEFFRSN